MPFGHHWIFSQNQWVKWEIGNWPKKSEKLVVCSRLEGHLPKWDTLQIVSHCHSKYLLHLVLNSTIRYEILRTHTSSRSHSLNWIWNSHLHLSVFLYNLLLSVSWACLMVMGIENSHLIPFYKGNWFCSYFWSAFPSFQWQTHAGLMMPPIILFVCVCVTVCAVTCVMELRIEFMWIFGTSHRCVHNYMLAIWRYSFHQKKYEGTEAAIMSFRGDFHFRWMIRTERPSGPQ